VRPTVAGCPLPWEYAGGAPNPPRADVEIRRLAVAVLRALHLEAPNIFGDMRSVPQEDGTETVETEHGKV
jgi:thymidylate synthase (FAD)